MSVTDQLSDKAKPEPEADEAGRLPLPAGEQAGYERLYAWLVPVAILAAWLLNITILGLPLGLLILNNIPKIIALQNPRREYAVITMDGRPVVRASGLPQFNFFLRAIYFLLIGWWWSAVWLLVSYLLCATILLLPVGLLMFRYVPLMTTLKRY